MNHSAPIPVWQTLLTQTSEPQTRIELFFIAGALALAWIAAFLIKRVSTHYVTKHPSETLMLEQIVRMEKLFTPLIAYGFLAISRTFTLGYGSSGEWTLAIMQLALAFALARVVVFIIKSKAVAYFIAVVILAISLLDVTGFMHVTEHALDTIAFTAGHFRLSMLNIVHGTIILVIVFWIASVLSRTIEAYLQKHAHFNYSTRELIVKFFKIFVYLVAFLVTLSAMGIDLTALAIFGGALGVGIGLGLQKLTANFVSGITLLIEKSIKIGDLIEVSGMTGWVRQLNVRYALIETFDGRELLIPNETLITSQVTNWTYTTNRARVEINLNIPFEADGKRARDIMLDAAKAHPRCLRHPEPACFLRDFTDYGQHFQLTFWIADVKEGRQAPQSDVLFAIAEGFKSAGISMVDRTRAE